MGHLEASSTAERATLNSLPSEILQQIFYFSTSKTFFQLLQVNRKFYGVAAESRELILHQLRHVPGIKLGLNDRAISTEELFLIFRQRATSNLYGAHFTAGCRNLEPSLLNGGLFDPRASCLIADTDAYTCVVFKNSLRIRLNSHNSAMYSETIESPYADGRAKVIQVVRKSYYISVLYAWTPPEKDLTEDTSHAEPTAISAPNQCTAANTKYDPRDGHRYSNKIPPSASDNDQVSYHLLHYDTFRNDRPIFFHIPTHKSLRGKSLSPVQLVVHNRLSCAILWDLPDSVSPSPNVTVCLYTAEHLPRYEQGAYNVWVVYPFDHPASPSDSDDDTCGSMRRHTYTETNKHGDTGNGGLHQGVEPDLRFLHFPLKPRSIALFKDGRRLSVFAPGSATPFTTLVANEPIRTRWLPPSLSASSLAGDDRPRNFRARVRRTNHTSIHGHHFTLSLPFFAHHETITPAPSDIGDFGDPVPELACITDLLALGTARIPRFNVTSAGGDIIGSGPEILTIVQIRKRLLYDTCMHTESKDDLPILPRPPRESRRRRTHTNPYPGQEVAPNFLTPEDPFADNDNGDGNDDNSEPDAEITTNAGLDDDNDFDALEGTNLRVVARLWGWNAQSTTLTGLDTVAVSPRGERIAAAQWDKVLIYALNPAALCEELWNDGNNSENGDGGNDTSSESANDSGDEAGIEADDDGPTPSENSNHNVGGDTSVGNGNNDDTHSPLQLSQLSVPNPVPDPPLPASHPLPASVSSSTSTAVSHLLHYHDHVKDKRLGGSIVELRPIVLKMDGGAVVRKIAWGISRSPRPEEDEDSDDEEGVANKDEDAKEDETSGCLKEKQNEEPGMKRNYNGIILDVEVPDSVQTEPSRPESLQQQQLPQPLSTEGNDTPTQLTNAKQPPDLTQPAPTPAQASLSNPTNDLPPAPFSDMSLNGQIKHITRSPEYYSFHNKIVLDLPPSIQVTSQPDGQNVVANISDSDVDAAPEPPIVIDLNPSAQSQANNDNEGDGNGGGEYPADHGMNYTATEAIARSSQPPQSSEKPPPRRKRLAVENELTIFTDRGIQVWDLSLWGRGRRVHEELECPV